MKKRIFHPQSSQPSKLFSSAVQCDQIVYVSGQGPIDIAKKQVIYGTIEEETILTLRNIEMILHAAGCSLNDVVKCTCYLADLNDFDAFNQTYQKFFPQEIPPVRTTVQANLLRGIKVEIDAIAHLPS